MASTCTRLLGRGVNDAAALSFRLRGLVTDLALWDDRVPSGYWALLEGLRAGSPLSTRFLTVGDLAVGVAVAAAGGVHTPATGADCS